MAKTELTWKKVSLSTSAADLQKAHAAEAKAQAVTDAILRKLAAGVEKVDPATIRISRKWGNLSYAVDAAAKAGGTSTSVSL